MLPRVRLTGVAILPSTAELQLHPCNTVRWEDDLQEEEWQLLMQLAVTGPPVWSQLHSRDTDLWHRAPLLVTREGHVLQFTWPYGTPPSLVG
jgi:hypothetical protein